MQRDKISIHWNAQVPSKRNAESGQNQEPGIPLGSPTQGQEPKGLNHPGCLNEH